MSLETLDIQPHVLSACLSAQLSDSKVIMLTPIYNIVHKTGLMEDEVVLLKKSVVKFFMENVTVCKEFKHLKFPTGCSIIDDCLGGGICYPGITEICGESASGKTQLCMQLCLNTSHRSNVESLYICTEDVFPAKRLHQMAISFKRKFYHAMNQEKKLTDKIFIEHISELDDLWGLLDARLPSLMEKSNIKLIILDSVAAIFRAEFDIQDMAERARMLAKLGNELQKICHKFNACVICINQVSDLFDGKSSNFNSDGSRRVTPALGLTWAYSVNTRIMLSRTKYIVAKEDLNLQKNELQHPDVVVRTLKLLFSPHLAPTQCFFYVDANGINDYTPQGNFVH